MFSVKVSSVERFSGSDYDPEMAFWLGGVTLIIRKFTAISRYKNCWEISQWLVFGLLYSLAL
jgi:hypothetical protein